MEIELAWVGGQAAGVVVIAALVNRYARAHRPRLRRVVSLFVIYVAMLATGTALREVDADWSRRFMVASDLFRVISLINMAGMAVFLLALPAVKLRLPTITGDLIVGITYIIATVVVLTRHGLNPSSVIATGAIASAVLAISLQTTLGNVLGGVALQLDGSIAEGDYIQLEGGRHGRVRAVRWRHTTVDTPDSTTIVVPNAQLLANNLTILLSHTGGRPARLAIQFTVSLAHAPARITRLVDEGLARSPIDNVQITPPPSCLCTALDRADGLALYAVRYFAVDVSRRDETDSQVRARVHAILLRHGISVASKEPLAPAPAHAYQDVLRSISLFRACTDDELAALSEDLKFVPYAAGEVIVRQGTPARWLYVMCTGTVEVRVRIDPDGEGPAGERTRVVATLTAPDFFGEMALLTGELRGADVVAHTDVECLRLGPEEIHRLIEARPAIATELSERLAARRVALDAVRTDLDEVARASLQARERERIRDGIMRFFGL